MNLEIVYKKTKDLIPYAMNARVHSDQQISQIAASIKEFGFNSPVAIDKDNGIICGHGRVLAAKKLNIPEIPTVCLSHLSDIQKKAYILADNKLALNASWDENILKLELEELDANDFKIEDFGFDIDEISSIINSEDSQGSDSSNSLQGNNSELNIKSPVYEIRGERPKISELCDSTKTEALIKSIDSADIPEDLKKFLRHAAERHCKFNYSAVAEYYAHCDAKVQELFEESALVILDINDAVKNNFIKLTSRLDQLIQETKGESND